MLDYTEEVWMNLVNVYRRLGSEEDTPSRAHLLETHAYMLPTARYGQFRYLITLRTLRSLYQTVPFRGREK